MNSRKKGGGKRTKLKRLLSVTGIFCALYLIVYMWFLLKGDADNPLGFINSNINLALYFVVTICYITFISATVKSFLLGEKYKSTFLKFWILAGVLTIFFVLLITMNYMSSDAAHPHEFTTPTEEY